MDSSDISKYTIERKSTTVMEPLILQSVPIRIENMIAGATAYLGTVQLEQYSYFLEHLSTNAFRLMDIDGRIEDTVKTLEVLRIEPQGKQITWRTQRTDVLHPTLNTGARQQSLFAEVERAFGGPAAVPVNLLRLTLSQPGNTAGKVCMVGVYSNGASWYEEHAFRLAVGPRAVNQAFQLTCTEDGIEGPIDRREWTSIPELGNGLIYRWLPSEVAKSQSAPMTISASIHLFVQTFGPANAAPVRIQVLTPE